VGSRIKSALGDAFTQTDLAKAAHTSTANVSRYLAGSIPIPLELIMAAARLMNLNGHWLLTGEGPMRAGEVDWSLIPYDVLQTEAARQRLAFEGDVRAFQERMRPLAGRTVPLPEFVKKAPGIRRPARAGLVEADQLPDDWRGRFVPLLGRIAAGEWGIDTLEAEQSPPGWAAWFVPWEDAPPGGFAVQVEGDSMEPQYRHGDVALVDGGRPVRQGISCVVVRKDGDRVPYIKRLRLRGKTARLESLNPEHAPIMAPASDIEAYAIVGTLNR
jgi:SOS-response transcriptional repressor LexA